MAKVFVITNAKGGVAKSTTAATIAMELARREYNVKLVDFDAQTNSSQYCGIQPSQALYDVLIRKMEWEDVWVEVPQSAFCGSGRLHVISTDDATNRLIVDKLEDESVVPDRFSELEADYVIVDTSPTMTDVHTGLFYAARWILLPTQCEKWSIGGVESTLMYIQRAHMIADESQQVGGVLGILPTIFDRRIGTHCDALNYLKKYYPGMILPEIHASKYWRESALASQFIGLYKPKSNANKEAKALVDFIEAAT